MLSRPEYAHFVRAQNPTGGTGGGSRIQSAQTAPMNPIAETQPKNLSEAVLLQMAAIQKQTPDPRVTPSVSFGLRPLAKQA